MARCVNGILGWTLVDIALSTGLRVSEVGKLTVEDIDLKRGSPAVHLLRKTGNFRKVQKQLGHNSPTITAALYADVTFEDMQARLSGLYA